MTPSCVFEAETMRQPAFGFGSRSAPLKTTLAQQKFPRTDSRLVQSIRHAKTLDSALFWINDLNELNDWNDWNQTVSVRLVAFRLL